MCRGQLDMFVYERGVGRMLIIVWAPVGWFTNFASKVSRIRPGTKPITLVKTLDSRSFHVLTSGAFPRDPNNSVNNSYGLEDMNRTCIGRFIWSGTVV